MIVMVGTFRPMEPEVEAEARRNLLERFMPALRAQPGFVAGYWAVASDGRWLSTTVWESVEAMRLGAQRANATPLLPGQNPARIPSPDTVEIFEVIAHAG